MATLNRLTLCGNLTQDVEIAYTPAGKAVAKMRLAVSEKRGDIESVVYIDVTAWERLAEMCKQQAHKGSTILCDGKLKMESWTDRNTGQNRSKLAMSAFNVQFFHTSRQDPTPPPFDPAKPQPVKATPESSLDDIPF